MSRRPRARSRLAYTLTEPLQNKKGSCGKQLPFLRYVAVTISRTQSANALFGGKDDGGTDGKRHGVQSQIVSIGEKLTKKRDDGEFTVRIIVGADEKHIKGEGQVVFQQIFVYLLVERDRGHEKCEEDGGGTEQRSPAHMAMAVYEQIDSENDLQSVVNHGLNIYACIDRKYGIGIDHDDQSRQERKGGQKGNKGTSNRAVLQKKYEGEHVERGRTELKGKGAPAVIPSGNSVNHDYGERQLLADLEKDDDDPTQKNDEPHGSVLCAPKQ